MIVEPDFLTHWKTKLLSAVLQDEKGPLYVLALWTHCNQRRVDRFEKMTSQKLAAICGWSGDADIFMNALEEAQFIDFEGDTLIAHDFGKVNAKLLSNWRNGNKGGRPPKDEEPNRNPTETQQKPIREEKRR